MASIQQSANSLFSSLLAASVTGSHAYRQSAMGQRQIAARKQAAELKNINKVLAAYAPEGKISPTATETELQEIQRIGEQGVQGTLNYAALTGNVERARAGVETGSRITSAVEQQREANVRQQNAENSAAAYKTMTPSEMGASAAAASIADEISRRFLRGGM